VHREDLVVQIRSEQIVVGACKLQPHQCGEEAGKGEEAERGNDEADADPLVIDR
jgi:hypothetical protein